MMDMKKLLPVMLGGFIKGLDLAEVTVPLDKVSEEFAALQQHLAKNGQELRRIRESKSGFVGYYVCKAGEPNLVPSPAKT